MDLGTRRLREEEFKASVDNLVRFYLMVLKLECGKQLAQL